MSESKDAEAENIARWADVELAHDIALMLERSGLARDLLAMAAGNYLGRSRTRMLLELLMDQERWYDN